MKPLDQAELQMLKSQTAHAHKLTQEAYIRMLRDQVAYYRLLAEGQGEAGRVAEHSR